MKTSVSSICWRHISQDSCPQVAYISSSNDVGAVISVLKTYHYTYIHNYTVKYYLRPGSVSTDFEKDITMQEYECNPRAASLTNRSQPRVDYVGY